MHVQETSEVSDHPDAFILKYLVTWLEVVVKIQFIRKA